MLKSTLSLIALFAVSGLAEAATPRSVNLDRKGDRIERRLDVKGNRIDRRLDLKGRHIDKRLDRHARRVAGRH